MTEISIFQTQKMSDSQRRTQINTPIAETVFSLYIHSTQHESLLPRLNSSSYSFNLLPFYFSQAKEEKSWYFNKNPSHPHVKLLCLPLAFSHWGSLRGACCLSVCPSVQRPKHTAQLTCWSPSVMEVTGAIPQVRDESMYPSEPMELLKFPC